MQICTEGVVLKVKDIDEADRVLTILTRDRGVITAFANGAKRIKSKLMSSTQMLAYSSFQLFKARDHYTVDSAESINVFFGIRNDIDKLSLAGYLSELTQCLAPQEDEAEGFLRLLLNCLSFMDSNTRTPQFIKPIFELKALALSGYMPNLICCSVCACYESEQMYFYLNSAKLVCTACMKEDYSEKILKVTGSVLSAMRYIIYSEFNKIFNFTLSDGCLKQLGEICEAYTLSQVGHSFKTLDFMKTVQLTSE